MAKQVELNKKKGKGTVQRENKPVWNNVQRLNHQNKFVPTAVLTRTGRFPINTASQAASTSTARKVNAVRPIVNENRPRNNFHKSHSPIRRPFNRTTAPRTKFSNQKVNTAEVKAVSAVGGKRETDNPQRALKNKGIVDSGCSRHMTGNKAYLAEYQDYNGGPVAFGGSKGYITGKGKIKTGKLDFEDVCFVKELQHFNLFSVSQMCDKKNKVLFTDTECLVLSSDFKLLLNFIPVTVENKANKIAGPKEANHSAVKRSEAKNGDVKLNRDTSPNINEEPKDQEDQAFLEELKRLKRQEKEANDAVEVFSTNTCNTVSTPISTASLSNVFSAGGPDLNNNEQDDSQIPSLEDTYDNLSDGIFTNASYDDDGAMADFTNLETTVNIGLHLNRLERSIKSGIYKHDFIHEYNENLMLKAELAKTKYMVEKKFFDEVGLRCSRLENHNVNLELKLQHQKERDAHLDFYYATKGNADTLWEIVEHARALRPLDSDLDSAYKWKPTGQTFTIAGNMCPLTRITATKVEPLKETTSKSITNPNPEIKIYHRKTKVAKFVRLEQRKQFLRF
ncbi:hypothetical protein Tco_0567494 [Tanacetum coccineum]